LQVPELISLPEGFFSSFDVVAHLSKEFGLEHKKTIASLCRNLEVKFFTGSCYGEVAIAHADLLRHKFTVYVSLEYDQSKSFHQVKISNSNQSRNRSGRDPVPFDGSSFQLELE
jgi:hypothetical protein